MKKLLVLIIAVCTTSVAVYSCKSMGKAAARYWTKKQIKAFKTKCEEGALGKFGESKGKDYCDCATDIIMEKYKNHDDAMKLGFTEILTTARTCATK